MTFQLDTTGAVPATRLGQKHITWGSLDTFTQGYVEAMPWATLGWRIYCGSTWIETIKNRANAQRSVDGGKRRHNAPLTMRPHGFSDLAPETLARTMADCERCVAGYKALGIQTIERFAGFNVWTLRQAGSLVEQGFPPLTVQLGDDGKVRFA